MIVRCWLIFGCLLLCGHLLSQSASRLPARDTSFTVNRELEKLKKDYPFIQSVNEPRTSSVKEQLDVPYCTNASRPLMMDVFKPAARLKQNGAAIMIIHGGGWRSGDRSQHHAMARRLAGLGYTCFTPEYRLSPEALYPAAVVDLKAALRYIHANAAALGIDPSRIVVAGFSAGGQLAALLGTTQQHKGFDEKGCFPNVAAQLHAVIDMDGILAFIHPESGEGDDSKRTSAATTWFGAPKNAKPELWKQASALHHVNAFTPPTLFINSSVDRMHAGREDYRKVLDHFGVYSEVKTFEGAPHSFPLFQPWFDSTIQLIDEFLHRLEPQKSTTIVVAADGSGDHSSIQNAFNAIPAGNNNPVIIYIRKGIYKEKLALDSTKRFVTMIGEDRFNTIITFDDHTGRVSPFGDTINTYTSHSFLQAADDFTARDITFQNTAGFSAGQAVALQVRGDRSRFFNCRFIGNQDVLFTSKPATRQYFEDCYIEGTTDFIFGPSTAWFEHCFIHSKKNSHVTAASTPRESRYGYVFNDCVFTGDTSLHNVSLGRPWRPFAHVIVMNSYLGEHIKAEGWANWNNTENFKTTTYAEYNNYGPSAANSGRLRWVKRLSADEAAEYEMTKVFRDWNPKRITR